MERLEKRDQDSLYIKDETYILYTEYRNQVASYHMDDGEIISTPKHYNNTANDGSEFIQSAPCLQRMHAFGDGCFCTIYEHL